MTARSKADAGRLGSAAALDANKFAVLWTTLDQALTPAFGALSEASAALLLWLHNWGPVGVMELARVAGLSQPACTRALDRLEAQGLVSRQRVEGKEVPLLLTPTGQTMARRMQAQRLQAADRLLAPLSATERQTLLTLVDKLVRAPVTDRAYAKHVCRYCDHRTCDGPLCPVGCRATELEGQAS